MYSGLAACCMDGMVRLVSCARDTRSKTCSIVLCDVIADPPAHHALSVSPPRVVSSTTDAKNGMPILVR